MKPRFVTPLILLACGAVAQAANLAEVVAEGDENASLARLLLDAQCHYGQGFGYAPALAAQEAEVYLNESLSDGVAPLKARSG